MVWAVYLLFLAGGFTGCVQAFRLWRSSSEAVRAPERKPGWHEDLP